MTTQSFVRSLLDLLFHRQVEGGTAEAQPLEGITNGVLSLEAPYVVRINPTGQSLQLGLSGETIIRRYDTGQANLITGVGLDRINAARVRVRWSDPSKPPPVGTVQSYSLISGTVLVKTGEQSVTTLELGEIPVTPIGKRLAVHTNLLGETSIQKLGTGERTNAELQARLGPDWRWATTDEATAYALKWYFIDKAEDLVNEVRDAGRVDGITFDEGNFSAALAALIQLAQGSLRGHIAHLIQVA